MAIEAVQRSFTRRIEGMAGRNRPDYWIRLKLLNLYSLERRRERYTVLYMWKILHNIVPNPGIEWKQNARTGVHIKLPDVAGSSRVNRLRRESLLYRGPRVYNAMPVCLRQMDSSESPNIIKFKINLDKFFLQIPDQPTVNGLKRAASSNSVIDQVNYIN
jgi:hypothetical protein